LLSPGLGLLILIFLILAVLSRMFARAILERIIYFIIQPTTIMKIYFCDINQSFKIWSSICKCCNASYLSTSFVKTSINIDGLRNLSSFFHLLLLLFFAICDSIFNYECKLGIFSAKISKNLLVEAFKSIKFLLITNSLVPERSIKKYSFSFQMNMEYFRK